MKISKLKWAALAAIMPVTACAEVDLDKLQLPDGFSISVYAQDVDGARQMALGDKGTLFVGSRREGKVYAVVDSNGDHMGDQVITIAKDLEMPSGIEFKNGALYVGAISRILRFDDIEKRLQNPPEPVVVADTLPTEPHHGWKYLRFAPDGSLFVPIGAPCNICDPGQQADIRRMDVSDGSWEIFAEGVRNSVGLAIHPVTGELWFTDNGRDLMGDDMPSCELNHAPVSGMHFGFPFCHQGDTLDPEFGEGKSCSDYTSPVINLGPHVAPLGLVFYTGKQFPAEYNNQLFVTEHGSWNRSNKIGYRIKLVNFDEQGRATGQQVFASGWLQGEDNWGRPNDVLLMPDGSMLVSDDQADVIYRISYSAP